MNDNKQIEEIAWIIQNGCSCSYGNGCEFKDNNFKKIYDKRLECENISRAIKIYDFLIPKGSVVLTEERHTALKLIEKYHIKSCGKNSVVLTTEEYEDLKNKESLLSKTALITKEELLMLHDNCKQARKQGIKEVIERLKESEYIKSIADDGYIVSYVELCQAIDKTAKEFGVEV